MYIHVYTYHIYIHVIYISYDTYATSCVSVYTCYIHIIYILCICIYMLYTYIHINYIITHGRDAIEYVYVHTYTWMSGVTRLPRVMPLDHR